MPTILPITKAITISNGSPVMATMSPRLLKFALTAHVAVSVGWLGAVAGFLALAIAGLVSRNAEMVRAAYLAMELTAWFVIVPLSFAAPLTGLVQSLGSQWGLFRHYWVLAKLLLTVLATVVLLMKMESISHVADIAVETALSSTDLHEARMSLVAHAGGGLLVLLTAATLGIYKPRGITPYGARKQRERHAVARPNAASRHVGFDDDTGETSELESTASTPRWVKAFAVIVIILILLRIILPLAGHDPGGH